MDSSNSTAKVIGLQGLVDFGDPMVSGPLRDIRRHPDYDVLVKRLSAEARAEGRREEAERSRAELAELKSETIHRMDVLLGEMASERNRFHEENREELLRLALAMTRRITAAEVSCDREGLAARLETCLESLGKESATLVRVHPEDHETLQTLRAEQGEEPSSKTPFRIVADSRVARGDIILEGGAGRVEAICGDALDRLEETMIQWHRAQEERHDADHD